MNGFTEILTLPAELLPWRWGVHIVAVGDEGTFYRIVGACKRVPAQRRKYDGTNKMWCFSEQTDIDYVCRELLRYGVDYEFFSVTINVPELEDVELDPEVWGDL